jgi:hypothetical protein
LALGHSGFFKTPVKWSAERPLPRQLARINSVPIGDVSLYRIDHLYHRWLSWAMELTYSPALYLMERSAFMLKTRISQSEFTMNIFYIIGVIVVVLFVAGFFGLHA